MCKKLADLRRVFKDVLGETSDDEKAIMRLKEEYDLIKIGVANARQWDSLITQ